MGNISCNSLVAYKNRPARVTEVRDKLTLELDDGTIRKVRPKDVTLLRSGGFTSVKELEPPEGDVEEAWQLLQGETVALPELAELIFGKASPGALWAAWQLLHEAVYFTGGMEGISARSEEEVRSIKDEKKARETMALEREALLERVRSGKILDSDRDLLKDVEELALDQRSGSRTLKDLGLEESRESAHSLLLRLEIWTPEINPWPHRYGLDLKREDPPIPDMPSENRLDLTHIKAFAIDDEGNSDPDDAISVDGDHIWVHVADTASVITPGSQLDAETRNRSATLYLPEKRCHMLPRKLRTHLGMGLQKISPALSFGFKVDSKGALSDICIQPSQVRVTRLSYEEAEGKLDSDPTLNSLYQVSQLFRRKRANQNATFIRLPEARIRVTDNRVEIRPLTPFKSREMVTDTMLMAGEAAARFALDNGFIIPFASQDPPEELHEPRNLAEAFAYRKQFKRTRFREVPDIHAGLGLSHYAQVTSPLRRYLDLLAHQQIRAFLAGGPLLSEKEILSAIYDTEPVLDAIKKAERDSNRHWSLVYLQQHPDWEGKAILAEKRDRFGVILIPELALEERINWASRLPLNQGIRVSVADIDFPQQKCILNPKRS